MDGHWGEYETVEMGHSCRVGNIPQEISDTEYHTTILYAPNSIFSPKSSVLSCRRPSGRIIEIRFGENRR
jgi:hypothetical protein